MAYLFLQRQVNPLIYSIKKTPRERVLRGVSIFAIIIDKSANRNFIFRQVYTIICEIGEL
jgi:hypothetical protein